MAGSKIVVLGTGGTIAGTADTPGEHLAYRSAQLGVAQLVAGVLGAKPWTLEAEQVAQIDSKNMDEALWQRLAARCEQVLRLEEGRLRALDEAQTRQYFGGV